VLGAVDWANLTVAGAFILGATLGAVAVLRLVRVVAEYLRGERDSRHPTVADDRPHAEDESDDPGDDQ